MSSLSQCWLLSIRWWLGVLDGSLNAHHHLHRGQQSLLVQQQLQHTELYRYVLQRVTIRRRKLRVLLVRLKSDNTELITHHVLRDHLR